MQEHGGEGEVHRSLEVRVGEDNVRVLAAEFECDPLDSRCGSGHYAGTRRDTAGERDHVHVAILRQRGTSLGPRAENQIGNAGEQTGFFQRSHQERGGRRRQLTRFEHDGVARQ
ncbi:hypothetical protein ACVWWN_002226 [Mycobacterium sp. URHB0021]|jgi:hypothetical protein